MLQTIMLVFLTSLNLSYANDVDQKELSLHRETNSHVFFEIKNLSGDVSVHLLKCTSMQECHVILQKGKKPTVDDKQVKVTGQMAEQLDQEFVGYFVNYKYGKNGEASKKNCGPTYELTMRTESHTLCKDDLTEIKSLEIFISKLNKELGQGQ